MAGRRLDGGLLTDQELELDDRQVAHVQDVCHQLTVSRPPMCVGTWAPVCHTMWHRGLMSRWQDVCRKWWGSGGAGRRRILDHEAAQQRARDRILRMARMLRTYLQVGSLSGDKRGRVELVFTHDFTREYKPPRKKRAEARRGRQEAGDEPDDNEYWNVEKVLSVFKKQGANGYWKWYSTLALEENHVW